MNALVASPFALLDAHGCLRFVTDIVHEDDALCLALACRAMRDALGARFPACPRAGGRAVAELAARVTADGVLDLSYDILDESDGDGSDGDGDDNLRGLRALPEGLGRLAYLPVCPRPQPGRGQIHLPAPGLWVLDLRENVELTALPAGLCSLVGLEELNLRCCGLRALPEGVGRLTGLRQLVLSWNRGLLLPEGLWSLTGLEELRLAGCGLTALPEGIGGLTGLKRLVLSGNRGLTALPVGLCALARLEVLNLEECRLTALPEALCALARLEDLSLRGCTRLRALPEGMEGLVGLKRLHLYFNERLTALPAGLGRLRNLEGLGLTPLAGCPGLAALKDLHEREGLPALLAHLAAQDGEPATGEAG